MNQQIFQDLRVSRFTDTGRKSLNHSVFYNYSDPAILD